MKNVKNTIKLLISIVSLCVFSVFLACCSEDDIEREDAAQQLSISLEGSLQNGAWSPDSQYIVFTRFHEGYNKEPASLYIYSTGSGGIRPLVSENSGNVNLPGSCWNSVRDAIIFSSSREPHDEIYMIDADAGPGTEVRVTNRTNTMAYEPSFSPDGGWIVFESHPLDTEDQGVITTYNLNGSSGYSALTDASQDCRQPNWSPAGDLILYQRNVNGQWDIWVMDTDGTNKRQVTSGEGNKTDASFSPDGQHIVFSSDAGVECANLFIIGINGGTPVQITFYDGYDGAPSWSGDNQIVFESYPGDPDRSDGITLWIIDVPQL